MTSLCHNELTMVIIYFHMVPLDLTRLNRYMKTATFNLDYNSHQAQDVNDEMKCIYCIIMYILNRPALNIIIYGFSMSCKKQNNVCTLVMNCFCTHLKDIFIPPAMKLEGYIGFTLSVCLSVCPSVCSLTFRVRPVASTVQDGFFPYLVQMINSMRGCVACDEP